MSWTRSLWKLLLPSDRTDSWAQWRMAHGVFYEEEKVSSLPSAGSADIAENTTSAVLPKLNHRAQMYRSQRPDEINLLMKWKQRDSRCDGRTEMSLWICNAEQIHSWKVHLYVSDVCGWPAQLPRFPGNLLVGCCWHNWSCHVRQFESTPSVCRLRSGLWWMSFLN